MVDTGRYVTEDVYEENAVEEAQEMLEEWNSKYDELSIKEIDELRDEVWETVIKIEKQDTRRLVFDKMKGNKEEHKDSFRKWCEETFIDKDDDNGKNQSISERYDEDTINKAKALLEEEHILKKVKAVLDHRIAGEDVNKLGLFLQLLSKDTDNPLMIFGIQKQGEGKSYLAKNVIDLFPDHMVEKLTDATKSSIYRIAEKEGKDFFDNKIVFFGEIPEDEDDREVFQIFRQLNSEGEVSNRLSTDENGSWETKKLELEGSPAVLSTTVNEALIDEQDMSRGMAYSPEMSEKQNKKVRQFQNRESEFPEEVLNPDEVDKASKAIECALDLLAEDDVELQNPFTRDFDEEIPIDTDNIKRDYPKTLQIASEMPAYLYHRQRPKKEVYGSKKTFVHWKDVARGLVINKKFINNMIRGHTDSTMDAYKEITKRMDFCDMSHSKMRTRAAKPDIRIEQDYFTNKDLEKWMGLASQTAREYTRKLDKMELIFKDSSTRPNKHYLTKKEGSETQGITLSGLHTILTSVIDRKGLGEWARKYYEITDISGGEGDILDKLAFTEDDLPVHCDFGLKACEDLPTPLYEEFSHNAVNEATGVKIAKEDGVIMCDFDSVSKAFSGKHGSEASDSEETEEQDSEQRSDSETEDGEDTYSTGEPKDALGSHLWDMINHDSKVQKNFVVESLSDEYEKHRILDYIEDAEWIEVFRKDASDKIRRSRQKAKVSSTQ